MNSNQKIDIGSDINLGIICPMANERDVVCKFVSEVLDECSSFAFKNVSMFAILDNVSTDGTLELLRKMAETEDRLNVIYAPENNCVVDAYIKGYTEALSAGCDWVLEMDAGFSHQPSAIPSFFMSMSEGYDCIFGSRFIDGGKFTDSSTSRYLISLGGTWLANLLLGTRLKDMTSGFELFSAKCLQNILKKGIHSKGPFFQTEIKFHARKDKWKEIPIHYRFASHHVEGKALSDALSCLYRLLITRIKGTN